MRSAEDIAALYHDRQTRLASRHMRMRRVSDVYNGRTELHLPELSADEQAAIPNLPQQGTDQFARRVGMALPNIISPPIRPGSMASEERANHRRMITYGWWERSGMAESLLVQRAMWFVSYASAPAIVRPDPVTKGPRWDVHSPFDVFPSRMHLGQITPADSVVRHRRDYRWLQDNYPAQASQVHRKHDCGPDDGFDVLEYIDDEEIVFAVLGHDEHDAWQSKPDPATMAVELKRAPNRAGTCWVVIPERMGLDAPIGHFDNVIGMYEMQATLMALEVIAVRRSIWPEPWLQNPNGPQQPDILQLPDAETGTPGIITNGQLTTVNMDPSFRSVNTMDRLERATRQTAGLPAELGGEAATGVRTARRGGQILSASMDWTLAEVQTALARSLHEENLRAIAIDKGYFNRRKSIYISVKGARGKVDYLPSETFEDHAEHVVKYPVIGNDPSDFVINGGQRIGQGSLSRRSFMENDPYVDDVDVEIQRIRLEGVEAAYMAALQTDMADPMAPWQAPQVAELGKRIKAGEDFFDAVEAIDQELKERQAQGAEAGSPEAMPGLAATGAPGGIPSIPEQGPSMQNMQALLGSLGTADMALAARGPSNASA